MVFGKAHEQIEIELKLEFDPANAKAIAAHPGLGGTKPEKRTLVSTYFDTDDRALQKGGVALRVRDTGERYVQTIKTLDETGELFERSEWEQEVAGPGPDLDAASRTALAPLRDDRVRNALRQIFQTRIERTLYRVDSNGSDIEVAVDRGRIASAKRQSAVCELELELKHGDPVELFRLARTISAQVPLQLGVKSKAERGYELAEDEHRLVEKATKVKLDARITTRDAFRAIGQNCLRQIVANAPGVCARYVEALHQMRIGLRRLRAAMAAFAEVTADARRERIEDELKWITKQLGPARDLDVFAADVLQPLNESHAGDETLDEAHREFARRRDQAYADAIAAVRSSQFCAILLDVAEWIAVGPWTTDTALEPLRERSVQEHASAEIARQRKRIKKRGKHLRELEPSKRHKLRIAAKNLRYTIEFFASIFPGGKNRKRQQAALSALKDLQDSLGALNDVVAREKLMADDGPSDADALRQLASDEYKVETLLEEAVSAYASFAEVKPFWR